MVIERKRCKTTTYSEPPVRVWICPARLLEDARHHVVQVMVGVGIVEPFGEAIDENPGIGRLHHDFGIRPVIVRDGKENVAVCFVRVGGIERPLAVLPVVIQEVVTHNGMHLDSAEEAASCFDQAKQKDCQGRADGCVNAILDAREDGDQHPREENKHLQRGDQPELIHRVWRSD